MESLFSYVGLSPGQLVLTKIEFEGHEIPINWAEEKQRPLGDRQTIRNVRIKKNEILLIVSHPEKDIFLVNSGGVKPITRHVVSFLRGESLCFMVSVSSLEEYIEAIDYTEVLNEIRSKNKKQK